MSKILTDNRQRNEILTDNRHVDPPPPPSIQALEKGFWLGGEGQ